MSDGRSLPVYRPIRSHTWLFVAHLFTLKTTTPGGNRGLPNLYKRIN